MKINGVSYHVEVTGHGDPLMMLHGFAGSGESWRSLVPDLASRFTVYTVDLLGHGRTESPESPDRYAMACAAEDLRAIASRCSADPPHLLGYSMGGRLALYYALRYPVRSLVLESASPGLADERERAARKADDEALADRIEHDGLTAFVAYWESLPLFRTQAALPDEMRLRLRSARMANNPVGLANSLRGMGTGVQPSLWSQLGRLDVAVLLVCGAFDPKFTAIGREMTRQIRNARLAIIPNAGHAVHLEQPTLFRDEALRFWRDLARRRMV